MVHYYYYSIRAGTSRGSPCVRSSRRARHRRVVLDTDSDSSPIATKQKSAPRRTIRRCISDSSSDSELPSFARDISGKTIDSSVKVVPNSSEWLQRPSDPKSKLQQFAYRKRNKELSSESIDCDVTSPECTHEMDKPSQQAICISDDDDDDDEHAVPVVENEHNIFTSADSKHGRRSSTHKKQAIELDCDFRENYSDPVSDDDDFSDNQKVAILDFVNNSTPDEMCDIPGFSVTKTKLLVKYRPFETWNSLVRLLSNTYYVLIPLIWSVECIDCFDLGIIFVFPISLLVGINLREDRGCNGCVVFYFLCRWIL